MNKTLFLSLVLAAVSATLFSCSKDDKTEPAYVGDTQMMACFNRIGIKTTDNAGQLMYIIPDNLPSKYNVEGKHLRFDAEVRSNSLTPTFPDPSVDASTVYQGSLSNVEEVQ